MQRCNRDRNIGFFAQHWKLELCRVFPHAVGTAKQKLQVRDHIRRKKVAQRCAKKSGSYTSVLFFRLEQSKQRLVDMSYAQRRVQRKHTRRYAFQNSLHLPPPLIEFCVSCSQLMAGGFDLLPVALQFFRHAIERLHEVAEFVGRRNLYSMIKIAARDFLRCFCQSGNWSRYES